MPLVSEHFRDDDDLQDCLVDDASHVVPGDSGDHVGLIQEALMKLGEGVIAAKEIEASFYGSTTTSAVLGYKTRKDIVNRSYQSKADNIVGKMTIERLDLDMQAYEKKPFSTLIARTKNGDPRHNHATCPSLQVGDHEGTPINPLPGRSVNIYGDSETDYLQFLDVAIDVNYTKKSHGSRELTWVSPSLGGIPDHTISNIFMRSSPLYDDNDMAAGYIFPRSTTGEILRMGAPGCRFTFTCNKTDVPKYLPKLLPLGMLTETVYIDRFGSSMPRGTPERLASMVAFIVTLF